MRDRLHRYQKLHNFDVEKENLLFVFPVHLERVLYGILAAWAPQWSPCSGGTGSWCPACHPWLRYPHLSSDPPPPPSLPCHQKNCSLVLWALPTPNSWFPMNFCQHLVKLNHNCKLENISILVTSLLISSIIIYDHRTEVFSFHHNFLTCFMTSTSRLISEPSPRPILDFPRTFVNIY